MLIQAGDSEVLRDEITLLAHKATLAGVNVTHELYEDMVHIFQIFSWLPAAEAAINSVGRWVRVTLPRIEDERRAERPSRSGLKTGEWMIDETGAGGSHLVGADGKDSGLPIGHVNSPPTATDRARGALRLDLKGPSIDMDFLPSSGSRSGSPTPTGSPARSPILPRSPEHIDRLCASPLRRAFTGFATSHHVSPASSPPLPSSSVRHRRLTQSAANMHASPATSIHGTSNPVSPSRRPRSPTMSVQPQPTTRARSMSHSDIFHLVEEYVEGGAANETVVYAPGGEVRSVGVLGEEEEDER